MFMTPEIDMESQKQRYQNGRTSKSKEYQNGISMYSFIMMAISNQFVGGKNHQVSVNNPGKFNWNIIYSVVQKNSCMFEFPASLPPTNLGLPLHIRSAVMEHVSLNLARFFTRPCRIAIKRSNIVCLWRIKTSMGNWKNSPHHRLTGEFTGENISPVKYWWNT